MGIVSPESPKQLTLVQEYSLLGEYSKRTGFARSRSECKDLPRRIPSSPTQSCPSEAMDNSRATDNHPESSHIRAWELTAN